MLGNLIRIVIIVALLTLIIAVAPIVLKWLTIAIKWIMSQGKWGIIILTACIIYAFLGHLLQVKL